MRLDLATDLRARIGAPDKDARLTNAFVEVKAGPLAAKNSAYPAKKETCVRKRPGCVTTGYDYTTPIQGAGGSLPYLIYDDTFSAFDAVPPTPPLIGDLVGGYYAMIDEPPTPPGPGDDYWSVTPPTSDRWRGTATIGLSDTPSATYPSNLIGAQAGSKAAAAKTFVEVTIAAISPGLKTLYDSSEIWAVNSKIFGTGYTYVEEFGYGRIKQDTQTHDDAITYPADWPAGSGVWTGMSSVPNDIIGIVCKKKTKTSFSALSTGAVGRISTADLPLSLESVTALITISGCDQPEYNGTFYASRDISTPNDGYLYFTLSGVPAVSPATGSKSMDYWVEL